MRLFDEYLIQCHVDNPLFATFSDAVGLRARRRVADGEALFFVLNSDWDQRVVVTL
jgi:hypothetical protein